jgi:hypothetical protein
MSLRKVVPLTGLLSAAVLAVACQENLPTYVKPDVQLSASVYSEDPIDIAELFGSPILGVDVTEGSGEETISQIVIPVPYSIRAKLHLFLDSNPQRYIDVSIDYWFTDPDDQIEPGKTVRCVLGAFPFRDREGNVWNSEEPDKSRHIVVAQGTAEIPKVGLKMNVPPRRITIIYPTP